MNLVTRCSPYSALHDDRDPRFAHNCELIEVSHIPSPKANFPICAKSETTPRRKQRLCKYHAPPFSAGVAVVIN
jgi:hypothetical protein